MDAVDRTYLEALSARVEARLAVLVDLEMDLRRLVLDLEALLATFREPQSAAASAPEAPDSG